MANWSIIYTPGYSRVTRLFFDSNDQLWVGGYNVFGKIIFDKNGRTVLKTIVSDTDDSSIREVEEIFETEKSIYIKNTIGNYYKVNSNSLLICNDTIRHSKCIFISNKKIYPNVNQQLTLSNGWIVLATSNRGLILVDQQGKYLFSLTEQNGLCADYISCIATDNRGSLWGATDNGIFCVYLPSCFSRFTPQENLKGEVVSVLRYQEKLYIGTLHDLYVLENNSFVVVSGITQAC